MKLETHESQEVDSISRQEPGTVKELDVVPEKPIVGPEPSRVSSEEPEQGALAFGEAQPYQAEHSPPFSRLLLPAPSVTEPQPDAHPERAAMLSARLAELERQLLAMHAAQIERDRLIAQLADQLVKKSALLEQAEANAAEAKKRAVLEQRELQAKLDEALEQAQSALQKASCAAEANEQSRRELTEMHAELEARKSESAALRLRLADNESGCTKSKAEAATYRTQTPAGLVDTDEYLVVHRLVERMQFMEAEIASLRWNEKSFEMMECRNEG